MVRDEIETKNKGTKVQWNMLTSANVTVVGKDVELTKNGRKLDVRVISPSGAQLKTTNTVPPHSYDAPNPGTTLVGFEIVIPANSKEDLVVLLLPEGAVENEIITAIGLGSWPGKK